MFHSRALRTFKHLPFIPSLSLWGTLGQITSISHSQLEQSKLWIIRQWTQWADVRLAEHRIKWQACSPIMLLKLLDVNPHKKKNWIARTPSLFMKECSVHAENNHLANSVHVDFIIPSRWPATCRQDFSNIYCTPATACMWRSQDNSLPSSIWVLWLELRPLVLWPGGFTCWAISPAHTRNFVRINNKQDHTSNVVLWNICKHVFIFMKRKKKVNCDQVTKAFSMTFGMLYMRPEVYQVLLD